MLTGRKMTADHSASMENNPLLIELRRIFVIQKIAARKEVAARMGVSADCLDRWVNGQREFPARFLSSLYNGLGQYIRLWSCLLQDTDLIVMQRPIAKVRQPETLMKDLLLRFGEVYRIFTKLLTKEPLSRGDISELEQEVNQAKAALDEALLIARIQLLEKEREQ